MMDVMELEADRRLIAMVKKFPALYDGEDPQYQDTVWKNAAWRKISAEIGMDAKLCRSRWFNMRDIYRKSLIRNCMKRQLGQGVRVYKYAKDLSFLNKFFANLLPAQEADPLSEDTDNGGDDDTSYSEPADGPSERSTSQPLEFAKVEPESPGPFLELEPSGRPLDAPSNASNAVNAFLACIEPTLKSLPPYLLSLAKGEIFAVVQKYELRMLGAGDGARVSTSTIDTK